MTDKNLILSVIVPTFQEELGIECFLERLMPSLRSLSSACHVVVVDSGTDTTAKKVEDCSRAGTLSNLTLIRSDKGRARQMNVGADHALRQCSAKGQHYLLFVHADNELPEDLCTWEYYLKVNRPKWGFFPVRLTGERWFFRLIEAGMNLRSRYTAVATGDQGIFVSTQTWMNIGGYKDIPLMEDVELSKRLRKRAAPYVHHQTIGSSSRRWLSGGVVRTIFLMWLLRLAYWLGISPSKLVKWYRAKVR